MAQSTVTGSKTMQGSWDASGATATKPARAGTSLPSTCSTGEFFFNTAAAAGQNVFLCKPDNTWTQMSGGAGSVASVFGRTGAVTAQSGDYAFSQLSGTATAAQLPAAGGDLSGTLASATVKGLQGRTVSSTAPSSGQVLTWNGSTWVPAAVAGSVGGDLSGTIASATVAGIQGKAVSSTAPSSGQVLSFNGTQWAPSSVSSSVGGDLSGSTSSATVRAIQGQAVATSTPASGQVLTWSGSSWGPQYPSGGGGSSTDLQLVFDGSTMISGQTMTSWSCSGSACTTTWTVPSNVNWVGVELWAGGGPGLGSGGGNGGAGGAGGGYGRRMCPVTAGGTLAIQVGLGGTSSAGWGAGVVGGGDSSFGTCIGAAAGVIASIYSNGNVPGAMKVNGLKAPAGPWFLNNGYWSTLVTDPTGSTGTNTAGYNASREDQGGWPGSGWIGGTGAGSNSGVAIGGGGGGGGGASQNATAGAGGTSVLGGVGGTGGSSSTACTAGGIPGGGGGGAYVAPSGNIAGCNGARGEVRVYYVQ
jgi:hypothetical protein